MKIWRVIQSFERQYANAWGRGEWGIGGKLCPECTGTDQKRVSPLNVEWGVGPLVAPGILITGCGEAMSVELFQRLGMISSAIRTGPVHFMPPYAGGEYPNEVTDKSYLELLPDSIPIASILASGSSVTDLEQCSTCGAYDFEIIGVEDKSSHYDSKSRELKISHSPRIPDKGLFISAMSIPGPFFRLQDCQWLLCTSNVKDTLESAGGRGVEFLDFGDVVG